MESNDQGGERLMKALSQYINKKDYQLRIYVKIRNNDI